MTIAPITTAPITNQSVSVDGVRSRVRTAGARDAREAVVFVHGNPGSSEDWVDLLGRVGVFARAVAPDMPGYGKADRPARFDFTIDGYARHLSGVIDALGIERVHLVLHDFGGPWGLVWAGQHPASVASVTLVNTGVLTGYRWHKFARVWRTPVLGELMQLLASRWRLGKLLNADNPRPFPPEFLDRIYDDLDRGQKRAVLRLYRATSDLAALAEHAAAALGPLHLPALVVWGAGDVYLPVKFAEQQRRYFKVQAVHVLPGCGHWPFIDEPERVAELVVPFLRERLAGA